MLTFAISSWLEIMYLVFCITLAISTVSVMITRPVLTKGNSENTLAAVIKRIESLENFMRRIDSKLQEEAITKSIVARNDCTLGDIMTTLLGELRSLSNKITEIHELISIQNFKIELKGGAADKTLSAAKEHTTEQSRCCTLKDYFGRRFNN